jgi:MFS family permease
MADDDGDYRRSDDYRRRASGGDTKSDAVQQSTFASRLTFYGVSALYILALKGIRAAIPHLVPVMAADLSFTFAQQGVLLASFFQGYFVTMIPAAKLTTLLGAKAVLTGCLGGGVAVFALLPAAARRFGSVGAQALFLILGLIQGGFSPALSTMNAIWIPADGQEKVWAIRGQTFAGDALCQIVASVAVPVLCSGGRWVRACTSCAGAAAVVTLLWQLLARDSPASKAAAKAPQPGATASASPAARIAWGIFKLPAVRGICGTWFCCVFASVAMMQMAPTVLMQRFNLTVAEAGRYIALGFSITVPGMFLTGSVSTQEMYP